MTSTTTLTRASQHIAARREAWTGIAFAVLFIAGVLVSSPPADNASNAAWTSNYTGILLVLAALSLAAFVTELWRTIREAAPTVSPLPVVAAGMSAACIAAGGIVMACISGAELVGKYPLPAPGLLRLSNDLGFALVGVAGMLAAALAVICLSVQGNRAGVIGNRTKVFGFVVSVVLLAGIAFVPILALLAWTVVLAVQWLRR
jgi:hypothetical protein